MNEKEECLYHYFRLLSLLEDDYGTISTAVKGEILESYQTALMREISALKDYLNALSKI